ncbi:MAG: DNA repair ATPase [Chloroflexi bacterium]|nr:DNA repair ATPase [Chloroflexota bacterium]
MAKKSQKTPPKTFVFRKHSNIGSADAIEDKKFLSESFIDNGEMEILSTCDHPQCILLGRTGSGKTALLERLSDTKEKVIKIAPEGLALTYISNSDVLGFFMATGVNMDLFYRLLWRHVFAVEIIREHYHIVNEQTRDSFLAKIKDRIFGNKSRQDAIQYLLKWGESFWKESEYRVKEITTKLEEELGVAVGGEIKTAVGGIKLNAESAKRLSEEEKAEIVHRGQAIVDRVQMKTLSEIISLLESDLLDDKQKKYYITIDRLDENWVNDDLRYQLIKALLDTVRDFNSKIENVKIIVAIREDLLDRVFRYTRSADYQEEKYKSLYLNLTWKEDELEELLNKRVEQLVREQYTKRVVTLRDLLPSLVGKEDPVKYILERTMLRPRDAIMFFNECIKLAEAKPKITQAMVYQAESIYSENRLRALADEWSSDYQNIIELGFLLKRFSSHFRISEIREQIHSGMLDFLIEKHREDFIQNVVEEKFNNGDIDGFIQEMFKILYKVGVIGVKPESYSSVLWSYQGHKLLNSEINKDAIIHIHPAFWRILGIQPA